MVVVDAVLLLLLVDIMAVAVVLVVSCGKSLFLRRSRRLRRRSRWLGGSCTAAFTGLVVAMVAGNSAILDHFRVTSTQSRPHDAKQTKHANHRDRLCQGCARQILWEYPEYHISTGSEWLQNKKPWSHKTDIEVLSSGCDMLPLGHAMRNLNSAQ